VCARANKTNINQNSAISMIRHAKINAGLYQEMRTAGYADEEFPEWWFSPARVDVEQDRLVSSEVEQERLVSSEVESDELKSSDVEVLTPATPRIPAPREEGLGRPVLRTQDDSTQLKTAEDDPTRRDSTQDNFTQAEINLLGSNGIIRGQDGVWVHYEKEPSGRTIIVRAVMVPFSVSSNSTSMTIRF
jgi:hypothetical protein